jgi:hypothetical protein
MSIWQFFEGEITLGRLFVLAFGLPLGLGILAKAFQFGLFVSKLMLRAQALLDRLPVGPGYKALCGLSMCSGIMFAVDRDPRSALNIDHMSSSQVLEQAWFAYEPWLKLGMASGFLLVVAGALSSAGLALARFAFPPPSGQNVLYLRAFANKRRSASFLRHFSQTWLERGPISVISGPDVASHVMDASTLLAFVDDKLEREFISNQDRAALDPKRC